MKLSDFNPKNIADLNPHLFGVPQRQAVTSDAVELERGLHDDIIKHCDTQWPRWKYIRARMDKRSTIGNGIQDFTIFLPGERTVLIECKTKTGKRSEAQNIWTKEMAMLGHTVHEVRSMAEFLEAVK